jgi:SnoaL-like domain
MRNTQLLVGIVLVAVVADVAVGQGQRAGTASSPALSTRDYIDIQQLAARYAFLIDTCTNGGNDFADLFTDDGEFSVSQQWGVAGTRATKGRAALVDAAGGDGKGACRDPKTTLGYGISHISVNHVITAAPAGATGKSYLLAIGVGGNPTTIERQGGYEDVYVKTPAGWRIKSRVHVFPNLRESVQFGGRGRQGGTADSAPSAPPGR